MGMGLGNRVSVLTLQIYDFAILVCANTLDLISVFMAFAGIGLFS